VEPEPCRILWPVHRPLGHAFRFVHVLPRARLLSLLRGDRKGNRGEPASHTGWASGHGQADTAGVVAAEVAACLCTPSVVFLIDQIIEPPHRFSETINKQQPAVEYSSGSVPVMHPPGVPVSARNTPTPTGGTVPS